MPSRDVAKKHQAGSLTCPVGFSGLSKVTLEVFVFA